MKFRSTQLTHKLARLRERFAKRLKPLKRHSTPLWMIAITVFLAGEAVYLYRENIRLQHLYSRPASYETCLTAAGSRVEETYPTTCITANGDAFIDPHARLQHTDQFDASTISWPEFTNHDYFFSYKCPPTSQHTVTSARTQDGIAFPYSQESCIEGENQVLFSIWKTTPGKSFTPEGIAAELSGASLIPTDYEQDMLGKYARIRYHEANTSGQIERTVTLIILPEQYIRIEGFPQEYYDSVVATFTFIRS